MTIRLFEGGFDPIPANANEDDSSLVSLDFSKLHDVLEHLEFPQLDLAEIGRVLKPNGVFVFITPNKRHPLAWLNQTLGRFSAVQDRLVAQLYGRAAADTFPTWYRVNSQSQIKNHIKTISNKSSFEFKIDQLHFIPDPTYLAFHPLIFRFMCWFETALPTSRRLHLVGVLRIGSH